MHQRKWGNQGLASLAYSNKDCVSQGYRHSNKVYKRKKEKRDANILVRH